MSEELEKQRLAIERGRLHNDGEWLKLEHHKIEQEGNRPMLEAGVRFAELTVRSLLLLNGAAALSLLTFAGSVHAHRYASAIMILGGGAALAVATAALSYLSQIMLAEFERQSWVVNLGEVMRVAAVVAGALSLCAFCWGIYAAANVLG